ncbi:Cupin domain-containing protein [Lachnospiraceae bacterium]|uniref:cupin domain-containing protein n=1 Tax=Butyrivibrio sp. AC2005 TaxID=1280672 RepID=UPI00041D62BB|nr:cupin domain-containing protein [Butyrivibrio sp. AC2005]SKB98382.1 Cupin domain-containing protein [Lachnospiraceae bacterium]
MSNYSKVSVVENPRTELHDQLGLTGAEVSINHLPAGASVPFVHAHKNNEEIYIILSGKGKAVIDGDEIVLAKGDVIRVSPEGKRQLFAAEDSEISYACIQVKAGSIEGYTADDAIMC